MGSVVHSEDVEVVLTEDLLPLILPVIRKREVLWYQNASAHTHQGSNGMVPMGVRTQIAFETKMDERQLYRILSGETASVDLIDADALLQACNLHINFVDVYTRSEVKRATQERAEILRWICKANGIYCPPKGCRRAVGEAARLRILRHFRQLEQVAA